MITADQWVIVTVDIVPLAEQIPSDSQAMTISVDEQTGVNGFIEAGDRINVIVTIDVELEFGSILGEIGDFGSEEESAVATEEEVPSITRTISRFVLQGLPVLAVGDEVRSDADDPVIVDVPSDEVATEPAPEVRVGLLTLEVSPEQAERLAYTMVTGSVWLTLVPEDFVETPTDGITLCTLFPDLGVLTVEFPGLEATCSGG